MNGEIRLLNQLLDGCALRSQALAGNIANASTPGYERRDVSFLEDLKSALRSGGIEDASKVTPTIQTEKAGRQVRLEDEFAALSENQLLFMTSAELLSRKYARLRSAIKGM